MARIDGIIFGYRIFAVGGDDVRILANALLSLGIAARIKRGCECEVRLSDAGRLREYLTGKIEFRESEVRGLPGFLYCNRKRYGTMAGLAIALLCLIFASGSVWDVRVADTDGVSSDETLELLSELGLSVGARWSKVDIDAIEARFLSESEDVAWLNVNRRGTVAYVTLKEKDVYPDPEVSDGYYNIVASCDAVIEEVSVGSGHATVKTGDVVKEGELLISGIIPGELGGGFLHAEGTVTGRVFDTYRVEVAKTATKKVYTYEKTCDLSYKILGFSINLLKNSGNLPSSCDIIEYKSETELFGRYKLPITKHVTVAAVYEETVYELSSDEMALSAAERLRELLSEGLADAELLRIRTYGGFTDGGYEMYADVTALRKIGRKARIDLNE